MASGWTNRLRNNVLEHYFRAANTPEQNAFMVALMVGASNVPSADHNTWSDVNSSQVATGNGYTSGGYELTRNATDFDVLTEDDTNNRALIQCKDIAWTATGGTLPASGSGARWAWLMDKHATPGSRDLCGWFDLVSARQVSSGQTLTLQDVEFRIA